ncbi:MAG: cation-translocating P-type ATPase [Candidatus Paceibacteria bacterium]
MAEPWHAFSRHDALTRFSVDEAYGLSSEEVRTRRAEAGRNEFSTERQFEALKLLFKQFKNPLFLILLAAFVGTIYLGETVNAAIIAAALAVNVIIGFVQEYRAGRAFEALLKTQAPHALVLRDGKPEEIFAAEIVPGDIVLLSAGIIVPADSYLLASSDFSVSEASLTGESREVKKKEGEVPAETPLYERTNMVFMGSPVLTGEARALVVATGGATEMGAVVEDLETYHDGKTPVEKSIQRLARFLSFFVITILIILVITGLLRGIAASEIVLLAIALAVSVVPEGMPAAVTAILAIGMERILKERGLVRNLLAAETLGSTTIVLTDKTGTLTEARLAISDLIADEERGFRNRTLTSSQCAVLRDAVRVAGAFVDGDKASTGYGDPIERAILSAALERDAFPDVEKEVARRADALPFKSERRFSAALYPALGKRPGTAYFLGAPELLLEGAEKIRFQGKEVRLSKERREVVAASINALAREGKRVIAVSYRNMATKELPRGDTEEGTLIEGTVFSGLIAFSDHVRHDVPDAIAEVVRAGVRVVMVTGDTPETAYAVATTADIARAGEKPVTGKMLDDMDDAELYQTLKTSSVFARILPTQKSRLVDVLTREGEVVAMTGDGVNDAPALKRAAIGVAVGSGTEVAREASDLVLLEDSFSIIVAAIREGRRIMDNLKKAVVHLTATSFHEVFIVSAAVLAGLPLPILPAQILWVNIFEEGFLTFGFAFEPGEKRSMERSPQELRMHTVLTSGIQRLIIMAGVITGLFSIGLYLWLLSRGLPIEEIRTIMFVVLALDAALFAISLKQLRQPFWKGPLLNNRYLVFALLLAVVGIVGTLAYAPLRELLSLAPIRLFDVVVLSLVALVNIVTIEFSKYIAIERPLAAEQAKIKY